MDRLLQQLSERLQKAFANRLVSVILYGSAAAGDHQERYSDINVLVVLTQVFRGGGTLQGTGGSGTSAGH